MTNSNQKSKITTFDGSGLYPEPKHLALNFKIKINQLIGHWSLGNWSFKKGFTLIELILSITIFLFIFGMGAIFVGDFLPHQALNAGGERLIQSLREARQSAVSRRYDSAWGVYLESASDPKQFTLFKGDAYTARDPAFDQLTVLHKALAFPSINLVSGRNEIVFSKQSGFTADHGSFRLQAKDRFIDILVNAKGIVNYTYSQ